MPDISIEEKVRRFIQERFLASAGLERVQEEESFIENGIIDSTGVLELVHFLEETFVIKIEDDELVPDNLDSIRNIVAFLGRKTSMNTLRE
jgi:acyl carrier protein